MGALASGSKERDTAAWLFCCCPKGLGFQPSAEGGGRTWTLAIHVDGHAVPMSCLGEPSSLLVNVVRICRHTEVGDLPSKQGRSLAGFTVHAGTIKSWFIHVSGHCRLFLFNLRCPPGFAYLELRSGGRLLLCSLVWVQLWLQGCFCLSTLSVTEGSELQPSPGQAQPGSGEGKSYDRQCWVTSVFAVLPSLFW